jgi:hypothetical protein
MKKNICEIDINFKFHADSLFDKPKTLHVTGTWAEEGFSDLSIFHAEADFTDEYEAAGLYGRIKEEADTAFRQWLDDKVIEREVDEYLEGRHACHA